MNVLSVKKNPKGFIVSFDIEDDLGVRWHWDRFRQRVRAPIADKEAGAQNGYFSETAHDACDELSEGGYIGEMSGVELFNRLLRFGETL